MPFSPHRKLWDSLAFRALVGLLALLVLASGWVAYQLYWIHQRHAALALHPSPPDFSAYFASGHHGPRRPQKISAPWSLRLFGEEGYSYLPLPLNQADAEFQRVQMLFPEAICVSAIHDEPATAPVIARPLNPPAATHTTRGSQ